MRKIGESSKIGCILIDFGWLRCPRLCKTTFCTMLDMKLMEAQVEQMPYGGFQAEMPAILKVRRMRHFLINKYILFQPLACVFL